MTVSNKLVTGKSTKETVKPLRGECRVISGVTVVTTLVCFVLFRTRGFGRIERPAFPAPSLLGAEGSIHDSGESRREIAARRHCEERLVRRSSTSEGGSDEAIHSSISRQHGLLR